MGYSGPGKAQARPGPRGVYSVRPRRLRSPTAESRRCEGSLLGTAAPGAKGYLQPHAGCSAGTRSPATGSGGKYRQGELRVVLGTTAPILAQGPTPPARAANFVACIF